MCLMLLLLLLVSLVGALAAGEAATGRTTLAGRQLCQAIAICKVRMHTILEVRKSSAKEKRARQADRKRPHRERLGPLRTCGGLPQAAALPVGLGAQRCIPPVRSGRCDCALLCLLAWFCLKIFQIG